MAKSVKVNFILNLINTATQMLFPLITFPYAARIMQPDGIGQVNFFSSILSYIVLFTSIGIPLYGIREVARVRDDMKQMNIVTAEILILNSILMSLLSR
jgi:O-antigen/teichoic acid export membrane protein